MTVRPDDESGPQGVAAGRPSGESAGRRTSGIRTEPGVVVDLCDAEAGAVVDLCDAEAGVVVDLCDAEAGAVVDLCDAEAGVVDLCARRLAWHGGTAGGLTVGASAAAAAIPAAAPTLGLLSTLVGSPLALLLLVNALNVLDAALTALWIEMGIALEANPIVDAIGFPAKVVAVGLGSYIVYRVRPRWLLAPIAALAAVCVYHVVGAAVVLGVPR